MAVTFEELQAAEKAAHWTETPVKKGLLKGNFQFANLRKYRHEVRNLLTGKPGYSQQEQEDRLKAARELLDEAIAYSQKRDFAAHQAAKAAAREAYEATLAQFAAENPFGVEDFDEEDEFLS